MRYFPFISCAAGLLVCSLGTPAAAQDVPTPVAEINTFLDRWHHAAAVSDEAAYFGALDSTAVYLGTDPDERWSKQAFHEWAKPHFARKSAWDLTPFGRHVTLAPGGAIAWFDEKIKWFDTPLNTWMGTWRGTGVVHRTAAGWRILQCSERGECILLGKKLQGATACALDLASVSFTVPSGTRLSCVKVGGQPEARQ